MSVLTQEQIDALNNFARTHPHLAKVFGYLASDSHEGLGDALNDSSSTGEITFKDGTRSFTDDTLSFNGNQFYLTQDSAGNPEVNLISDGGGGGVTDHGDLTGLLDDDHPQYLLVDGTRAFTGDQSMGGNQLTNVGAPVAGTDAARLQDIGPGFYGIVFKDGTRTFKDDTISFNNNDFYLSKDSAGNPEVNLRKDSSWALHGDFLNIPYETVAVEEYVPIQQTVLTFVGRTSRGSLAVVLRVSPIHQVTWAAGSGAFHKVYFYPIQSIYKATGFNTAQIADRMTMDFYSLSNDVTNFSWTLMGTEQV